ncbi:polysaccharide pyruvyl transferase family protein [Schlegelella sp. S2-27]|uniref:Polysaccharide pyruvyl transferase family protein n=1 Tax=Caldimonas mangrovi TaxID=2944811 RepID=A0ABT0YJV0_9BURK|nr:polysaccharide pyruvyl transferase family protein [Caldimonas mangrovi]MCM5679010.1 polysaccharide pyruvyl transferase family protein [Caldimonas mangrovi]
MNILLTTFPEQRSANVGDALIAFSALNLLQARYREYSPKVLYREFDLDTLGHHKADSVLAPGFSVSEGVYRNLYSLYADLDRLAHFYPVGCSFQTPLIPGKPLNAFRYGNDTVSFLRNMATRFGPLPCRDASIVRILENNGIAAVYSGDLALFDETLVGKEFTGSAEPSSIVVTIGHHPKYAHQSLRLMHLLKEHFKDAKLYVAFHSRPNGHSLQLAAQATRLGFSELHLYGSVDNLNIYDSIDFHIGYRLHGHVAFLRRRKPSVLLMEDVRSYGFASTPGMEVGCIQAFVQDSLEPEEKAAEAAIGFARDQLRENFLGYARCFASIDRTYTDFIAPYFNNLARNLYLEDSATHKTQYLTEVPIS